MKKRVASGRLSSAPGRFNAFFRLTPLPPVGQQAHGLQGGGLGRVDLLQTIVGVGRYTDVMDLRFAGSRRCSQLDPYIVVAQLFQALRNIYPI